MEICKFRKPNDLLKTGAIYAGTKEIPQDKIQICGLLLQLYLGEVPAICQHPTLTQTQCPTAIEVFGTKKIS